MYRSLVTFLAVAVFLSAVPQSTFAQSQRKAEFEKTIVAFPDVCLTTKLSRKSAEKKAKSFGLKIPTRYSSPSTGAVFNLKITTNGKPVGQPGRQHYWICQMLSRGQFFDQAFPKITAAMKAKGFKLTGKKTTSQDGVRGHQAKYRASGLIFDLLVADAPPRKNLDGRSRKVATTILSLTARPPK